MPAVEIYTLPGVVSVQPITRDVSIVRYHGKEGGGFGSPSLFTLTMRHDGDGEVSFFAADTLGSRYTTETSRTMRSAMRALGVKRVHYERRTSRPRAQTIVLVPGTLRQ